MSLYYTHWPNPGRGIQPIGRAQNREGENYNYKYLRMHITYISWHRYKKWREPGPTPHMMAYSNRRNFYLKDIITKTPVSNSSKETNPKTNKENRGVRVRYYWESSLPYINTKKEWAKFKAAHTCLNYFTKDQECKGCKDSKSNGEKRKGDSIDNSKTKHARHDMKKN